MNYNSPYSQGTRRPYPSKNCQNAVPYGTNAARPYNVMSEPSCLNVSKPACSDTIINNNRSFSNNNCNDNKPPQNCCISVNVDKSDCEAGCDGPDKEMDARLDGFAKAMGYVPYTKYEDVCCNAKGLMQGTIFNNLVFNFMRRRCN